MAPAAGIHGVLRRISAVLFWSVIAAAFIGPGTVTTCGAAGARFGTTLLWALTFSGVACFTLQEAAARVTAVSGATLAEAIRHRATSRLARSVSVVLITGAILVGCAAYEAGNLLGAVTGVRLAVGSADAVWPWWVLTAAAGMLLATGTADAVARSMGALVAVMATAFLATALRIAPQLPAIASGAAVPRIPDGADLVVLGLVGTTVVPYNVFLGSGLARGQSLAEVRFGLAVAIGLGVVVSMAVAVVGTAAGTPFTFAGLAGTLGERLGGWATTAFAIGLAGAGLSSAVTAPLAAAVTAAGLFGRTAAGRLGERGSHYRAVWAAVLVTGLAFGLAGFRPVPLILAVQALNGVLLPFVAAFLLLVVNDRGIMGDRVNGAVANLAAGGTVMVSIALGAWGVLRAATSAIEGPPPSRTTVLAVSLTVSVLLAVPLARAIVRVRRR